MKEIILENILQSLENPQKDQIINLSEDIQIQAKKSLTRMFELASN